MMNKTVFVIIGAILIISGVLITAREAGLLPMRMYRLSLAPGKTLGIGVDISKVRPPILATVEKGGSYEFKVKISNTGNVDWDWWWVTFRITKEGASYTTVRCPHPVTCPDLEGMAAVEVCDNLIDDPRCRENLGSWNLVCENVKCIPDDTIVTFDCDPNCNLKAGQSLEWKVRIEVPPDEQEGAKHYIILNAAAHSPGFAEKVFSYDVEELTVGSGIVGSVTITMIGVALSLAGLFTALLAWRKP